MRLNPHCALLCPASLHLVTQEGPDGLGARFDALRMGGNCKSQPLANIGQVIFCIQSSNLGVIKPWSSFGLHDCDQNTHNPDLNILVVWGVRLLWWVTDHWQPRLVIGAATGHHKLASWVRLRHYFVSTAAETPTKPPNWFILHHEKPAV